MLLLFCLSPQDALGDAKASILWCSGLAIWMNDVINCVKRKKQNKTRRQQSKVYRFIFSTGIMGGCKVSIHNSINIDATKSWNFYIANDSFETIKWIPRIHHRISCLHGLKENWSVRIWPFTIFRYASYNFSTACWIQLLVTCGYYADCNPQKINRITAPSQHRGPKRYVT